ncbi:hypothetical protein SDC9_168803 [bioreactor metagenome]|uniref:Uncharacterized protein n=1 Tax=bioreactor metagenome TaxID=1076179 RepID=A0A645GBJ6_9ZZZZ
MPLKMNDGNIVPGHGFILINVKSGTIVESNGNFAGILHHVPVRYNGAGRSDIKSGTAVYCSEKSIIHGDGGNAYYGRLALQNNLILLQNLVLIQKS